MLEEKLNLKIQDQLHEEHAGEIAEEAAPVLATPALAGAFVGGAAVVTGAYAAGKAVG
ncbi:hypothetical protein HCC61_27470 [Streptomyces sp. HNM0575]|jgi:hypothetical protein|uniref:Class IIb bacteriocin, lactobin A/cerein 7B family n=1 Tax=Streptomyces marispadix TaxID=2922868 RepID=A0ABS9SYE3_9ACTN|nr:MULTISPECIES: hypothetical protein [Streptomyces]MCH6161218.1 hypothetical protein [Streptomyces marispadix]NLU76330.1 hypothetical protein [Streptomyces sp. HNM0575]